MSTPPGSPTTFAGYENISLHDCHLYGVFWSTGEPDEGDWTSEIAFDVDYITEWICGSDGRARFKIAPARVVFSGVSDIEVDIQWRPTGFQVIPVPVVISTLQRERIADQKLFLDQPYYSWSIEFQQPTGARVSFGALDVVVTLLSTPLESARQYLTRSERLGRVHR
jgi:hypothetical protein